MNMSDDEKLIYNKLLEMDKELADIKNILENNTNRDIILIENEVKNLNERMAEV